MPDLTLILLVVALVCALGAMSYELWNLSWITRPRLVNLTTPYLIKIACPMCGGSGYIMYGDALAVYADDCQFCDETGHVWRPE